MTHNGRSHVRAMLVAAFMLAPAVAPAQRGPVSTKRIPVGKDKKPTPPHTDTVHIYHFDTLYLTPPRTDTVWRADTVWRERLEILKDCNYIPAILGGAIGGAVVGGVIGHNWPRDRGIDTLTIGAPITTATPELGTFVYSITGMVVGCAVCKFLKP